MDQIIDINGYSIEKSEIDVIISKIIEVLEQKNITYAIAYMILEEVKNELENNVIKKFV